MKRNSFFILYILLFHKIIAFSQNNTDTVNLSLDEVITLACDSSISRFIADNSLLSEYWVYKNYKSGKLPMVEFNSTVTDFSRSYQQEYNFTDSSYHYINQQTLASYANIALTQSITKTGGKIYIDSDISRLENIKSKSTTQYTATLFRIGFSQKIFGFNSLKWDERIMPLKYEKAKLEFIKSIQDISTKAIEYFFNVAHAQLELEIALQSYDVANSLVVIGKERFSIGSILKEDLITMQIDLINAKNEVLKSKQNLENAEIQLFSLIRINNYNSINLIIPDSIPELKIDTEFAINAAFANNPEIIDNMKVIIEAERDIEEARFNKKFKAELNSSFGLNQSSSMFYDSFKAPTDQEMINISLTIPILDWGISKRAYEIAKKQREITLLSIGQKEIDFRKNVLASITSFNLQNNIVDGAKQVNNLAKESYELTLNRFKIGQADITKLKLVKDYYTNSQINYLISIKDFWQKLFELQKVTLFDYRKNQGLTSEFEEYFELNLN